MKIITINYYN